VLPVQADESLAVHWTHVCVVASQMAAPVEHAPAPLVTPGMHPTQAPELVSQTIPPPGPGPPAPQRAPPSTAHDAWQLWVVGEHTGVPPEHCALETQATHAWVVVSQCGRAMFVQSVSARQQLGPGFAHAVADPELDCELLPFCDEPFCDVPLWEVPLCDVPFCDE
jgi:hypothetical protein